MDDQSSAAILGLVALAVSLTSLIVSYLLLRDQHDPAVTVYAIADRRRPSFINLVIKNVGKGIAHDVHFFASEPVPAKAFGFANAPVPRSMGDGPLITGIPMLHPDESRILTWGQYGGLKAAGLAERDLTIRAKYKSKPRLRITQSKHVSISVISVRSFEGTDASDHNYDRDASQALKDLVQLLRSTIDFDGNLQVRMTSQNRESE